MMRMWKRRLVLVAASVATVAVAGCGSSGNSGGSGGGGSSVPPGVTQARQQVAKLSAPTTGYPVPTASVTGVSKFSGRTVYYIPLVQEIPGFVVTAQTMKTALAKAGLSLQVCNGGGQPSTIAACVQQAAGANAAGIVLDAIPYGLAQNALNAAKAKGVPIIIADQIPPAGTTNTNQVTYVPGVINQPSQIAWWLIADSKGKGNAIIAEEGDSPSSKQYVTDSLAIYKKYCPGCKITVKMITAVTNSMVASAASSDILSTPGVKYFYTEFEDTLQPTVQGLQQSGKSATVAVAVAGGSAGGLGMLKGNSPVKAVVTVDQAYAGWALTDETLRLMTKSGPVTETFPSRLFTRSNINSIPVTTAAQASGQWFGNTSYQGAFAKLWGAG